MIAIGCATSDERAFRASGAPTMETIDEGNSLMLRHHRFDSIDVPYNEMLAAAALREDLEAVVLVHQDAVIDRGSDLPSAIRWIFEEHADTAVIAAVVDQPRGELNEAIAAAVVLSPWAARNLRFDPAVGGSADASAQDIVLQAGAGGHRAVTASLGLGRAWSPPEPSVRRRELTAMVALKRKWSHASAPTGGPRRRESCA